MGRYKIINYKHFVMVLVTIDSSGGVGCRQLYVKSGFTKGKTAYVTTDSKAHTNLDMMSRFSARANWNVHEDMTGKKLFVSPACKLNREIIRNSGYKIVLDKDNADLIVLPQFYSPEFFTTRMAISDNEELLCLVNIRRASDYVLMDLSSEEIEKAESCARSWLLRNWNIDPDKFVTFKYDDASEFRICFVKKCAEYESLFEDDAAQHRYLSEVYLPLTPSYEMNPDTLEVMMHCNDAGLLTKMVQATDWQNYPLTLCCILQRHPYSVVRNEATSTILKAIGWDEFWYDNPREWGKNRVIFPDDWNLTQKLILRSYGADGEEGGFVPLREDKGRMDMDCDRWVGWTKHRLVVRPLYITEPTPFSTLMDIVKKN